jgi:membrane-bound ClpP family serine protease
MTNLYRIPSFYAHAINGILLFLAVLVLFFNFSKVSKIGTYKVTILLILFSIGIGVHGLSHQGLEKNYNFNPLQG